MKQRIKFLCMMSLTLSLIMAIQLAMAVNDAREILAEEVEETSVATAVRIIEYPEEEADELIRERDAARKTEGLVVLEDGSVLYWTLDDIIQHIDFWYTETEITEVTLCVQGEDGMCNDPTIWASDTWIVLDRMGLSGFGDTSSVHEILHSGAFDAVTLHPENMEKPVRPEVREVVVETMARKVYEGMGAPEELVGRTLPSDVHFFRNPDYQYNHNHYYYGWDEGPEYDPYAAPHNPYV